MEDALTIQDRDGRTAPAQIDPASGAATVQLADGSWAVLESSSLTLQDRGRLALFDGSFEDLGHHSETLVFQEVEERLRVGKAELETGRVTVRKTTSERTETVEVPLASERVEIERVPVGTFVDEAPTVREEGGATVYPVVEERLVVVKRLFLKEEVRVRRVAHTRTHTQDIKLRSAEVSVERVPGERPAEPGAA